MRKGITIFLELILIPLIIIGGAILFREKYYVWIAFCVAVISVIPLLYSFERRDSTAKELMVLAVLIALSVVGRFVFFALPGFKPVVALVIIVGVWLGGEAGFVVGSLTALVSNFYFGQGPWTPFQMFSWGVIGLAAGMLSGMLKKHRLLLYGFGILAGVAFSLMMDIWTVLWADGQLLPSKYKAALLAALPVTVEYAVSNVLFLMLLAEPIGRKLDRLKKRDGLFLSQK